MNAYRAHFPFGLTLVPYAATISTATGTRFIQNASKAAWTDAWINDPYVGARASNMRYLTSMGEDCYAGLERTWTAPIDDVPGKDVSLMLCPIGRFAPVPILPKGGIANDYYQDSSKWTAAGAAPFAQRIMEVYGNQPHIIAWQIGDDISRTRRMNAAITLAKAIQDIDPYGRPALFDVVDDDGYVWSQVATGDLKVALTYAYPCRNYIGGAMSMEGDFHAEKFSPALDITDSRSGGRDWIDFIRRRMAPVPSSVPRWLYGQLHGFGVNLRQPTPRELRLQTWLAIGEGFTGIWWFTVDNSPAPAQWNGSADVSRYADDYPVLTGMSTRLHPSLRQALIGTYRAAVNPFTATGGGSTGYPINYPNAYISTLQNSAGDRYVVICNRSLSSASVVISSATVTGNLVNMETGDVVPIGGAVTFPALDGTIWKVIP